MPTTLAIEKLARRTRRSRMRRFAASGRFVLGARLAGELGRVPGWHLEVAPQAVAATRAARARIGPRRVASRRNRPTNLERPGRCWSICTSGGGRAWASRAASRRKRFTIFIARLLERLLERGQLRMSWLELDGTPAAAEYHLADGTATYAYQGGVDPDRLAEEPGRLSTILCLRRAIEEGHRQFDFLRGDEPYKAHWRPTPRATYDYRVVPNRRLAGCAAVC